MIVIIYSNNEYTMIYINYNNDMVGYSLYHKHTRTHIHTYIHIYIYTYTHIHIHTH